MQVSSIQSLTIHENNNTKTMCLIISKYLCFQWCLNANITTCFYMKMAEQKDLDGPLSLVINLSCSLDFLQIFSLVLASNISPLFFFCWFMETILLLFLLFSRKGRGKY